MVCGHHGHCLCPSWSLFVAIMVIVCVHHGHCLWPSWSLFVAVMVMVCGRHCRTPVCALPLCACMYACDCVQEIQRLECEVMTSSGGTLTHRHWKQIWDRLDRTSTDPTSQPSELSGVDMMTARLHAENWHRRCTVELLVKGKLLSEATKAFSQPHHFERFNYTTAAYCDYCTHVLWGLLKTGQFSLSVHLSVCGYSCV